MTIFECFIGGWINPANQDVVDAINADPTMKVTGRGALNKELKRTRKDKELVAKGLNNANT